MPTVLRKGKYRFFFFSNEGNEPVHIHVEAGDNYAKFWLSPIVLSRSVGFNAVELGKLRRLIEENESIFMEKWYEFFNR